MGTDLGTDFGTDFLNPIFPVPNEDGFFPLRIPLFLRDVPGPCSSNSLADKKWETLDVLSIAICERLWSPCLELD